MIENKALEGLSNGEVIFTMGTEHRRTARVYGVGADSITFELLDATCRLQSSDVLSDVEIMLDGKLAYRGELSIMGVVPSGAMSICEARVSGDWVLDPFGATAFFDRVAEHLEEHTTRWAREHEVRADFRVSVSDLVTYFSGLESWCGWMERGALGERSDARVREQQILEKLGPIVSYEIQSHFADYERVTKYLSEEERGAHRRHLMQAVHRFVLQSPFSHRCFTKPLGYAGDYEMVRLMLSDPFQGATLFAKLINYAFMETGPVRAHKNRIEFLEKKMRSIIAARGAEGLRTRILSLGCGPAEDVRRVILNEPLAELCDFELLDFSRETLVSTRRQLNEAQESSERTVNVEYIEESIQGFVRQASNGTCYPLEGYDFVYCAGLFDYLQQRFCKKLTEVMGGLTRPGGEVLVTNVSRENTIPAVMADFLEWVLVERNEEEMLELAPSENLGYVKELKSDSTRINLFLELHKLKFADRDVGESKKPKTAQGARSGVLKEIRG